MKAVSIFSGHPSDAIKWHAMQVPIAKIKTQNVPTGSRANQTLRLMKLNSKDTDEVINPRIEC
jgi:hypothetical protein